MRPAVFLDRDGTINVDHGFVHRPEDLELIEGAAQSIARLNRADFHVIVVTNQSGVARGLFTETDVERFHLEIEARLRAAGGHIDRWYYCPFHPTDGIGAYRCESRLRKPDIGMFERACGDFDIDVTRSWMIGDKLEDMVFARRCGLRGVLVKTGHGARVLQEHREPAWFSVADSIVHAVASILEADPAEL